MDGVASLSGGTAVEYETLTWATPAKASYQLADLRAAQRQAGKYQAAIPADIADLEVALPARVLADAEEASNEIARFDAELGDEVAPFASILLRTESAASSNIENLTASARAIAEAETLGDTSRRNAAMIVSNTEAMKAAIALADQIDEDAILAMHAALMRASHPDTAGKWRTEQVWIGGGTFGPRGADFVAPHHERIHAGIEDLLTFGQRNDIPTLPQIAIAHAQFETIHPFPDGNGQQAANPSNHRPRLGRTTDQHRRIFSRTRVLPGGRPCTDSRKALRRLGIGGGERSTPSRRPAVDTRKLGLKDHCPPRLGSSPGCGLADQAAGVQRARAPA